VIKPKTYSFIPLLFKIEMDIKSGHINAINYKYLVTMNLIEDCFPINNIFTFNIIHLISISIYHTLFSYHS
jgi:hypothetical protein